MVRSGHSDTHNGRIWHAGRDAYGRSSTAEAYSNTTTGMAYSLRIGEGEDPLLIFPANSSNRYAGYSLRCLAD